MVNVFDIRTRKPLQPTDRRFGLGGRIADKPGALDPYSQIQEIFLDLLRAAREEGFDYTSFIVVMPHVSEEQSMMIAALNHLPFNEQLELMRRATERLEQTTSHNPTGAA